MFDLTKKINTSNVFYVLAALTTAVSMWRTYVGIEMQHDVVSAIVGALVIGIVLYAALHTLLNHKHIGVKIAGGVLFGVFFFASGETINMGAEYKTNKEANDASALLRSDKLAAAKLANEKDNAFRSDLRSQIESLEASNAADRADAKALKADIRRQIAELVKANDSDKEQVERYQALVKRHNKPQTNSANARNAIAEIDKRTVKIDRLTARIEKVGNPLEQKIQVRETQINGLRNQLNSQSHSVGSTSSVENGPTETGNGRSFHSYLYDASTAVLMLFARWYRPEEEIADIVEVAMDEDTESFDNSVLMSPVMTADDAATLDAMSSHNSVMSLDSICDVPQENMQSNIESIHREKEANEPPYATREAFKEALKRRKPEPNDDGFIPAALAIRECDEINDPRPAKKFFQECCAEGILEAFEVTNRGCFFKYPASVPGQTKLNLQVVA